MNARHVQRIAPLACTPRVLLLATCAVMLAASALLADVRRLPGTQNVQLVRLTGRLGAPVPGDKGTTELVLMRNRTEYPLQLVDLRVLSGDVLPGAILSAITLHRINYYLRGEESILQPLAGAAGQTVTISGYTRLGSHDLFVTEIAIAPPGTPTPKT